MIEVNKIRKNFEYICKKNIAIIIMIILICPIIALSYSFFVVNTNNYRASEMFIGNLLYSIKVNGEPTNVATALPGENEVIVEITSLNSISSNYKLVYSNNPNVIVFYASDDNQPSFGGIISTRTITLRIDNSTNNNQNLELSIVGGFSHNEVSEIDIPDGYSEVVQSYYKWDYETVALFVNDARVVELDRNKSYRLQSFTCNGDEVVKWYNANHTLSIEKMTASTKCQLNFIEQSLDIWNSYSCANGSVGSSPFTLNYTGNCSITHDEDDNWKVKFLTTGDLTFTANTKVDVFLVGGGGGGKADNSPIGAGGGGGYTNSYSNYQIETGRTYHIIVGAGGECSSNGGASTAFGYSAEGGKTNNSISTSKFFGGDGGSGGGAFNKSGGTDGEDGINQSSYKSGYGQGFTTREFGEELGTLYSSGGSSNNTLSVIDNSGNGGNGGTSSSVCRASSGVVIIRNMRIIKVYGEDYFSYGGSYEIFAENGTDWKIKLYTSGLLIPKVDMTIDLFLVGGGAGGKKDNEPKGAGGGGGYTLTKKSINLYAGQEYNIIIGLGGKIGINGGNTSAFGYIAEGGKVANSSGNNAYSGGDGGSGGAVFANQIGSEDGNNGSNYGSYYGGFGQGYSTKEFGEVGQTMYSGGGSSGSGACNSSGGGCSSHISGYRNTGGGGSGGNDYISTGSGGSGVVVIRNSRVVKINNQDYFIYDGTYEVIEESNENWKVMFYSSGTLIPRKNMNIDIFLVGGGAGGKTDNSPIGAGGGGGYTLTKKSINLYTGQEYNIIIGSGGKIGINGGNTSAFGYVAEGGKAANSSGNNVYSGGDGGSGGAVFANQIGGEDGNNGLNNGSYYGGFGQGYSTREFGEVGQTMYSGGGSSGSGACNSSGGGCSSHTNGYRNTGGGGCGGTNIVSSGVGGSGIVVIRNSRTIKFSNQDYFVYDGTYEVIEEYDNNWRIKFYSSGTLIPRKNMNIDVFLVGGGAGGKIDDSPNGAGGGGGYTYTKTSITLTAGEPYYLIVGQGGKINEDGGETSAFGYTTPGGKYLNSRGTSVLFGGDGGSGGGCFSLQGGENGTSGGTSGTYYGGSGQGTTTREFGELSGTIYSGGGSPHSVSPTASGGGGRGRPNGLRNSGGGGAGGTNVSNAGVGGSGIIVIRNERN